MTQEIIVYRNPGEAAVWHMIQDNPEIVLGFFIWILVFFAIMITADTFFQRKYFFKYRKYGGVYYLMAIASVIGIFAAKIIL